MWCEWHEVRGKLRVWRKVVGLVGNGWHNQYENTLLKKKSKGERAMPKTPIFLNGRHNTNATEIVCLAY